MKPVAYVSVLVTASLWFLTAPAHAKGTRLDAEGTTQGVVSACERVSASTGTQNAVLGTLEATASSQEIARAGKQLTAVWTRFSTDLAKLKPADKQDVAFVTTAKSVVSTQLRKFKSFQSLALKNKIDEALKALAFTDAEFSKEDAFQRSLAARADGQHCVAFGEWEDVELPAVPLQADSWFKDSATMVYSPLAPENQVSNSEFQKQHKRVYKAVEGRQIKGPGGETRGLMTVFLMRSAIRSSDALYDQVASTIIDSSATPIVLNDSDQAELQVGPLLDVVYLRRSNGIVTFAGPASANGDRVKSIAAEWLRNITTA